MRASKLLSQFTANLLRLLPPSPVGWLWRAVFILALMPGKHSVAATPDTFVLPPPQTYLASAPVFSAIENNLLAAKNAYDRLDLKTLDIARHQFANSRHPLTPYVTYWWLAANLAKSNSFAIAEANAIQAFLTANADLSIADNLRRDWLKILGSQSQWNLFNAALPTLITDDTEVTCHAWRYRLEQADQDAASEARALWNAGKTAADACYAVFQTVNAANGFSTDDIWRRVRMLLENKLVNDARRSAAFIKNLPTDFEPTTAKINLDARRYLTRATPDATSRASVELYLFAITRLARNDARSSAELLEKHAARLSANDRAHAWGQVALYGGMQHEPETLDWFQRAEMASPDAPLNDLQAAWKARAALRAANWTAVRVAIAAMSPVEKREPAWRYWLAHAIEKDPSGVAKPAEQINNLKMVLARENNFYGQLAAEELGVTSRPNWQSNKPVPAELETMAARSGMLRVLALYGLNLKVEGLQEWSAVTRHFNDRELLAAAEVARRNDLADRAISAANRTLAEHDYAQRYPLPYRDALAFSATSNQLDEAWIYGLIRQESRFMADAKSRVGAMGLMQLMPATARWAAKQSGMKNFAVNRSLDIPVNLNLGTYYLRRIYQDLGHTVLATAAYNAGPGRARRWCAETPLSGAIYAETIPFDETRDYVKKVMANKWYYRDRLGAAPQTLTELMGIVPARNDRNARGLDASAAIATLPLALNQSSQKLNPSSANTTLTISSITK